jgi:serine O-acetyltransferase
MAVVCYSRPIYSPTFDIMGCMAIQERLIYLSKIAGLGPLATFSLRLLGVNVPACVQIGKGIELPHGAVGLVVHEDTIIGSGVKLYQGVTLGRSDTHLPAQETKQGGHIEVGDGAMIGANACILFKSGSVLTIGSGAVVGANSVVLSSIPAGEIWAGNPARLVATR